MKKLTPRAWTFIFAGIALLALVLLSASLNALEMSAGRPVSYNRIAPNLVEESIEPGTLRTLLVIFRIMMILGWVLLPLYIIMILVSKDERKRFLRFVASVAPFLILLYFLANNMSQREAAEEGPNAMFGDMPLGESAGGEVAPPEFIPPPAWVTTFTTIMIALVITLVLIGIFYAFWRRSQNRLRLQGPLQKVERQAQQALDTIRAGGDLSEAILRCYVQMVDTLKEYRGLYRDQDMTPHEFELFLDQHGVPGEPVHQLTRLFEEVRYGAVKPGRKDEQVAISSLSAIVSACQRQRAAERRG